MKEVEISGGGIVNVDLPGDPDQVSRTARELASIGARLRRQSRTASSAGAQASRCWKGSASIAYANRNNQHVRSAGAGADELDRGGRRGQEFSKQLRRIQAQGRAADRERLRLIGQLDGALRDRRHLAAGLGPELSGVEEEIRTLRRKISDQERILVGLTRDLAGLRKKFGLDLLDLVTPDMVAWFVTAKAGISDFKTVIRTPVTVGGLINAVRKHRKAVRSGDPIAAMRALKDIRRARDTLLAPPGNPAQQVTRARKIAESKVGRKVLGPRASAAIVRTASSSPMTRIVTLGTPVGTVLTVRAGYQDASTGDGKGGIQGVVTRVTGVGAMLGAPLMLGRHPYLMAGGALLVGTHMVWKAGMRSWDRSRGVKTVPFKDRPAAERIRLMSPTMQRGSGLMSPGSQAQRRFLEPGRQDATP